jgi:alanine racemase
MNVLNLFFFIRYIKRKDMRKTRVTISKSNFLHNYNFIKSQVGDTKIIAVVKANAYGHGAVELSKILSKEGVYAFAVAYVEEGVNLRKAGITEPILVLVQQSVEDIPEIVEYNLQPATGSVDFCRQLSEYSLISNKKTKVHLFVDTGMNRDGVSPNQALQFMYDTEGMNGVEFEGVCTHFASSALDRDYSNHQLQDFTSTVNLLKEKGFKFPLVHTASSATLINYPAAHFNAVRLGIAMYGYAPDERISFKYNIKPILTLKTSVIIVRRIKQGESVSYNRQYVTDKDTNIVTIPIGYGDGYFKTLSGKAECIINDKKYPIVGAICMDEIMINVGDDDVQVGDEVILIGESKSHTITAYDLANKIGTIPYEVTTLIAPRVPRVYVD